MKKKMKAGFTLAETLITVALLGIIFLAVGGGVIVFQRAYDDVTKHANAQTMLSTAVLEMTSDLKDATTTEIKSDGTVNSFFTTYRGYAIRYINSNVDGITVDPVDASLVNLPVLTKQMNSVGLVTFVENLTFDTVKGVFRFKIDVVKAVDVVVNGSSYKLDTDAIKYNEQEIVVRPTNAITPSIVG